MAPRLAVARSSHGPAEMMSGGLIIACIVFANVALAIVFLIVVTTPRAESRRPMPARDDQTPWGDMINIPMEARVSVHKRGAK
jgi:hypothetical protein